MPLQLDKTAPVQCQIRTHISASADAVWSVLVDFRKWPEWMLLIHRAELEGPLKPGSILSWSIAELDIRSELVDVEPGRLLSWQGTSGTQVGRHIWTLLPDKSGVVVDNSESVSGVEDPEHHTERLYEALSYWNAALKKRVESLVN